MSAPVADYCYSHETYYLEAACQPCTQGIPPLPHPHAPEDPHTWPAVDLADLQPLWESAVRENWNPNTCGPECDWCGECEWCRNLHAEPAAVAREGER